MSIDSWIPVVAGEEIGWLGEVSAVSHLLSRNTPFFKAAHECLTRSFSRADASGEGGGKLRPGGGSCRKPSIWDTTFIITYRKRHEADAAMAERRGDGNLAPWGPDFVDANVGTEILPKVLQTILHVMQCTSIRCNALANDAVQRTCT